MVCLLVKMGGKGVRFGAQVPKQFYEVNGLPLFAYVLKKYNNIHEIDKFIIVSNEEWMDVTREYATDILGDKLLEIVGGGSTNAYSTYNGVRCAAKYLEEKDILLVHDVTDPIINENAIRNVILSAYESGCAAVVTEQVHTLYTKDEDGYITGTIEKKLVGSGYSPEAFTFDVISNCFLNASEKELNEMTSAVAVVLAHKYQVKTVLSHQVDIKITYHEDMEALKLLIYNSEKLYQDY